MNIHRQKFCFKCKKKSSFFNNKVLKIIKAIILLVIIFIYLKNINLPFKHSNILNDKVTIIESKEYKNFKELKEKIN